MTIKSTQVTGGGSIGECGSQPSWLFMASRINFYSNIAISLIRISDIANSK